jgi:hypothetical protein
MTDRHSGSHGDIQTDRQTDRDRTPPPPWGGGTGVGGCLLPYNQTDRLADRQTERLGQTKPGRKTPELEVGTDSLDRQPA